MAVVDEYSTLVNKNRPPHLAVYVDGASRGNPGPAAVGVVITNESGEVIRELAQAIGRATNNQAEYRALILGLEEASKLGAGHVDVSMDSELIVKQLAGRYRVRNPELRVLFQRVEQLLKGFPTYSITHIVRERNSRADALANLALDSH